MFGFGKKEKQPSIEEEVIGQISEIAKRSGLRLAYDDPNDRHQFRLHMVGAGKLFDLIKTHGRQAEEQFCKSFAPQAERIIKEQLAVKPSGSVDKRIADGWQKAWFCFSQFSLPLYLERDPSEVVSSNGHLKSYRLVITKSKDSLFIKPEGGVKKP